MYLCLWHSTLKLHSYVFLRVPMGKQEFFLQTFVYMKRVKHPSTNIFIWNKVHRLTYLVTILIHYCICWYEHRREGFAAEHILWYITTPNNANSTHKRTDGNWLSIVKNFRSDWMGTGFNQSHQTDGVHRRNYELHTCINHLQSPVLS